MKLSCNREKLHHAFQLASTVAPNRSPKEILNSIKLEAKDEEVLLTATDLESSIRIQVEQVDVQVPGSCLLNVVRVGNILRELNDSQLELETTESGITLRGEHSEFHLPSANPDEYPVVAEFSESSYCEVPARLFREMVRRTTFATDTENSRFALGGVLFEIAGEEITAVATDGRRLVRMTGSCKPVQGHKTNGPTTIIPTKTLTLMERSIGDKDEVVHLAARANDVVLRTPRATIQSSLVEGRFPNWRQVIPNRTSSIIIESNVGPFFSSVRQAAVVADPESRGIDFKFGHGSMVVGSRTADVGQSRIELPIPYTGETVHVMMDHRYVSDFCRVLDPDMTFQLDIQSASDPALFRTEDGMIYVVMPMARDQ